MIFYFIDLLTKSSSNSVEATTICNDLGNSNPDLARAITVAMNIMHMFDRARRTKVERLHV